MIELDGTQQFDDDHCPDCGHDYDACACDYCEINPYEPITFHGAVVIVVAVMSFALGWAWGGCA